MEPEEPEAEPEELDVEEPTQEPSSEPTAPQEPEDRSPNEVEDHEPTRVGNVDLSSSNTASPVQFPRSLTSSSTSGARRCTLFTCMARFPWPFLFVVPIAYALLIGFGWATDDKVEGQVARLWIADKGSYAQDQAYAKSLGTGDMQASSFAALAISRDGGNILTAERLEEVRARMQATESTTIEYKGMTFTWDDLCFENPAPYQFPCLRLSAMDLFQEARWTFEEPDRVAYYQDIIQDLLVRPRLPRFGVLQEYCQDACQLVLAYRTDPASVGFPENVPNPLALFADVGGLEYNHPCRICIEENYTNVVNEIYNRAGTGFKLFQGYVLQAAQSSNNAQDKEQLNDIATKLGQLIESITKDDVVDFFSYYVARGLYGELGVNEYMKKYEQFAEAIQQCQIGAIFFGMTCPDPAVDNATARQHLLNHADNAFSSVCSSGAPMPFWSEPDGTGHLFQRNSEGTLWPVSGSGINMSASIDSLQDYLINHIIFGATIDPNSQSWHDQVDANPLYAWFMASLIPAGYGTICGNGNLTGTNTGVEKFDVNSTEQLAIETQRWCTEYDVPNDVNWTGTGNNTYSKQHFARMWYDLLFASDSILGIVQGKDDPYSWTTGAGCGYSLRGERYSYTKQTDQDILRNASRLVYNIDEGQSMGPVDRNLLIGGASPAVGQYNYDHPLQRVTVLQTLYALLVAKDIVRRVQNCNRPQELGGPLEITEADAKSILYNWKEAMEAAWNEGWDDETNGQVQFVSFSDESGGSVGSTGRMLKEMTLDNNTLMTVSIIVIAVFSCLFLFSFDIIESRVLLTMIGVGLVVLSFYAAIGFGLLVNVKINLAVAWTLPFVILGLGVDDVYIVLLAIKKQGGYRKRHWIKAMEEVVVPVTMTSLVNASMFAILNLSDIPAVYKTTQIACYCVIALYLSVVFCFPAYCYLDLKRQEAGRMDILFCLRSSRPKMEGTREDFRNIYLYDKFYKPIVLVSNRTRRYFSHVIIVLISLSIVGVGVWGTTQSEVGLGLEDFFPTEHPAGRWAILRTEELASWSVSINWGALNYTDPSTQLKMIKQFEDVVATTRIAQVDTKQLWMAQFLIWTTRHCGDNLARKNFGELRCGRDQMFQDNSTCSGTWVPNEFGLREKNIQNMTDQTCIAYEGGICRPWDQMHPADLNGTSFGEESARGQVFCPVIDGWSDEKWKFCLRSWRNITGVGHRFVLHEDHGSPTNCSGVYHQDENLTWPIPFSNGPIMFAFDLFSHQATLDMMADVRALCDDDQELHCWMSGIPFDYWSQYEGIYGVLATLAAYAIAAGFGIAAIFLFARVSYVQHHVSWQILGGSLLGALFIAITIIFTLVSVIGLSIMVGVSLTGFSNLAFILSIGFAVEYSVHIVSRWMSASMAYVTSLERVEYTMSFLMIPTFMSFVSSTIGVICLAFTKIQFNRVFFFRPLIIVMFVSYWMGCWFLPVVLIYADWDVVKWGKPGQASSSSRTLTEPSLSLRPNLNKHLKRVQV